MSLLLAMALAPATSVGLAPMPHEARVFGNWIVGCDNTASCTAIALEDGSQEQATAKLAITWNASQLAHPQVEIEPPSTAGWEISIDGREVFKGSKTLSGISGRQLTSLMARGRQLALVSSLGIPTQQASLSGLAAALLYMEERQGRLGTASAVIRRGTGRPGPIQAQRVNLSRPNPSGHLPAGLDISQQHTGNDCPTGIGRTEKPRIARLDSQSTLLLVARPCDSGAYNLSYDVVIVDNLRHRRPARLDYPGGMSGEENASDLTNAAWDAKRRRLTSTILHRGTGDCGVRNEYVWDGAMFRLAYQEVMPECRGSMRFVPVWRADVME